MPFEYKKDVDLLVGAHRAAETLRRAGKPIWSDTLKIKHLFKDAGDDADSKDIGNKIAAIIRRQFAGKLDVESNSHDSDLEEIADRFETIKADGDDSEQDDFNYALSDLYDWADRERIWIK